MAWPYRVVDLTSGVIDPTDTIVECASPEEAARQVLGIDVIRSGLKRDLVARVYWQVPGNPLNMVRLYRRSDAP